MEAGAAAMNTPNNPSATIERLERMIDDGPAGLSMAYTELAGELVDSVSFSAALPLDRAEAFAVELVALLERYRQ